MEVPNAQFLSELVKNHSSATTKLTWEELCAQVTSRVPPKKKQKYNQWGERMPNSDSEVDEDDPADKDLFMSRQILFRLSGSTFNDLRLNKALLSVLRHVDAIHIPLLQIDFSSGLISDWNRAMVDLTGLSKSNVVGKSYADLLSEWAPSLSGEYHSAAVDWAGKEKDDKMDSDYLEDRKNESKNREHYMFPMPLPVKSV